MNIFLDQRSSKLFIFVFIALTLTCSLKKELFFTWAFNIFGHVHTRSFSVCRYMYYTLFSLNFCSTTGSLRNLWPFNYLAIAREINHFEVERETRRQKSVFFIVSTKITYVFYVYTLYLNSIKHIT